MHCCSFWHGPAGVLMCISYQLIKAFPLSRVFFVLTPSHTSKQAVCNARYEIIAWTMNCPGSQNDRTAFKHSGFDTVLKTMPPGCFIVGDAAYPASDRVLVPYPGTALTLSQDAYNFYQSQARISIEQAFGIMVSK